MVKRTGPNTLPWGMPLSTVLYSEKDLLTLTRWVRLDRKLDIQFSKSPSMPYALSLFSSTLIENGYHPSLNHPKKGTVNAKHSYARRNSHLVNLK